MLLFPHSKTLYLNVRLCSFPMTKTETGYCQKMHQFAVGIYRWLFTHHQNNVFLLHTIIVLFMTYVICSTCSLLALN